MSQITDTQADKPLDLITIGRASVDLYGQQIGTRLEDVASFAKSVGGCPTNISVGTARLGLKSALLTRVGKEQMGRFIREQLEREGVETKGIVTDPERLTALAILAVESDHSFPLLFYRDNCADSALCEDDISEDFIRSARHPGDRHAFRQAAYGCRPAQGDPHRQGKRRQGRVRYRLPPEPLGPCRS
ncbi:PfkB family carbohydrate kinase [Rhizobium sp. RCAM05350]|nr:PfkB family carbohydrate kinase [Rhizobium sp. RCAM05350]